MSTVVISSNEVL